MMEQYVTACHPVFWALCLTLLAVGPSLAVIMGLCAHFWLSTYNKPFRLDLTWRDLTWPDLTQPDLLIHLICTLSFPDPRYSERPFHSFNCLALVLGCLDNHIWPDPLLYHTLRLASSFPQTASCPCSFVSVLNCASAQIFTTPTPCLAFWCLPKKLAYFWWPSGQNLLVFTFWGLLGE